MLIDFAYSLQIHLSKQNLADVENAARILGFLEVEELCKKVFEDLIESSVLCKKVLEDLIE